MVVVLMIKNIGNIQLPEELFDLIQTKAKHDQSVDDYNEITQRPEGYNKTDFNKLPYTTKFNRLIDPVIISIYYGLYLSKELPPLEGEPIILDKKHEFSANISNQIDVFRHLMFCLWININGYPFECSDGVEYRKSLYQFIQKILDDTYIVNVIIPFYLEKAANTDHGTSFLFRMRESNFIKWESNDISPEYFAIEFNLIQEDFYNSIIKPLFEKIGMES